MKLLFLTLFTSLASYGAHALIASRSTGILHCSFNPGPGQLECPPGYRCCGPITSEGGTCFVGETGPCPL
ncbi:hypothetical protein BYT27DRAFT_7201252 [Phlegmacium glaucopus]|nr:hypothetical protein BYT27DRAFT_7201252 [Phlegmacium glaucopus]